MVYFGSYINGFEILCIQKEAETPVLQKGAVQAVQDLYDVVRHDVLSINMRFDKPQSFFSLVFGPLFLGNMYICHVFSRENYETWNLLSKARTEGRLFSKLKWPKDAELVCSDFTPCPCLSFCCYILHSIL